MLIGLFVTGRSLLNLVGAFAYHHHSVQIDIGGKMRLFTGQFGCYKSTGLRERSEARWRVRTWSDGKAHDYWVENGQFTTIGNTRASFLALAEREAVLNMIAKWEVDDSLQAAA